MEGRAGDRGVEVTWWWLSFCDAHLPKGTQFLGVAIVFAHDMVGAVKVAHALGINPGGQVLGAPFVGIPPEKYRERSLTREEAEIAATMTEETT